MLLNIAGRLTVKFYEKGENVCKQGDYGDKLYIIYKGGVYSRIIISYMLL